MLNTVRVYHVHPGNGQSVAYRTYDPPAGKYFSAGGAARLPYCRLPAPRLSRRLPTWTRGISATNIKAGAKYGYELLWVALSANLIVMLFQALSAKVVIATGRNLPSPI
jgi:Natural resistance-associated macrophage protein